MDRSARLRAVSSSFNQALLRTRELEQQGKLTSERTVALYGLMMQATAGDCKTSNPPPSEAEGRSDEALRWMAWKKKAGMSREAAMVAYVDQVNLIDEELTTGGAALMESSSTLGGYYSSGDIYASGDGQPHPAKSGVLYKQRDVFKGWRPRTFVLQDKLLRYYINEDDPLPRGTLSLEGCVVTPNSADHTLTKRIEGDTVELFPFAITHPDSTRVYHLASHSREDMEEWVHALRLAASAGPRRVSIRRKASLEGTRLFRRSDSFSEASPGSAEGGTGASGMPPLAAMAPPHLVKKIAKALAALKENTAATEHWERVFSRHDVTVFRRPGLWESVRGEGLIHEHPVSVLLAVLDMDQRRQYDPHLDLGRRVQLFSSHTFLDYVHFKAVWPTKDRDMYNVVHWQVEEGGVITILAFSDGDKYPDEDGCIRAECILAGWIIRPVEVPAEGNGGHGEGTTMNGGPVLHSRVSYLLQTDLKGQLPHRIRSHVSENQPMIIASVRKFLMSKREAGGNGAVSDYACSLPLGYTNSQVEPLMEALNRRVVAAEVPRRPTHQRSLSIKEIQAELPPLVSAKVDDAVRALIESEANREGWEPIKSRQGDSVEPACRSFVKEADVAEVGVLNVRSEGLINHPPAAVLQAVSTLDLVNIWSGTTEFSTHDTLFNVHTWIVYQRLQAMFPMPTRDACQLMHWRVVEEGKRAVLVAVDDSFHPEEEGYVRAHVNEGWVLDSEDDGKATRVCCIWSMDFQGVLTQAIRMELSDKQGSVVSSVRNFLDEYYAPGSAKPRIGPPLDQVVLDNASLQALVVSWNRWSPTMLPARVRPSDVDTSNRRRTSGDRPPTIPKLALSRSSSAPVRCNSDTDLAAQARHLDRRVTFGDGAAGLPPPPPTPTKTPGSASGSVEGPSASSASPMSQTPITTDSSASLRAESPVPSRHPSSPPPILDHASSLHDLVSGLMSSSLEKSSPLLSQSATHLAALFAPVLVYLACDRTYRGLTFALTVAVAARFVLSGMGRPVAVSQRGTEWGQENIKARVHVKFPVEVRRLKRYIEGKHKETGADITVLHVAIRALGVALRQIPELNGHTVMGTFYRMCTADVSCEVRLKDGTYGLLKVAEADRKSIPEVSRLLAIKIEALSDGRDHFYARRKLILSACPPLVAWALDTVFTYLGAGLGLSAPALGIRAFPQGGCVVLTSPAVSHRAGAESDFVVEPEKGAGDFLSPMVLTIGAISSMPKAEGSNQLVMVPVLNVSMMIRLAGGGLSHVRRLTDLVQKYMADPRHLDAYAANNAGTQAGERTGEEER